MTFFSIILSYILYLNSFLPLVIQNRIQSWKRKFDRLELSLDQGELYSHLAVVALELHAFSRRFYLSVESSAKKHRSTTVLWDRHFKYPLNSAIWIVKKFSADLLSRAENSRTDDKRKIIRLVTSQRLPGSVRRIRDLSKSVKLLGDFPAARGVISSIWLGELENGSQVAVKLFIPFNPTKMKKDFIHEARVWFHSSHHENIAPLLGVAQLRDTLALISPWMPGRDLRTYLTAHPNANRLELLADVARGLGYLHSQGIAYGNIRLTTIVVSSMGRAYLSSFLAAHFQDDDYIPTDELTWRFIFPEVYDEPSNKREEPVSTLESDVYMYGMVTLEVMTNNTHNRLALMRNVLKGKLVQRPHALVNLGFTDDVWLLVNSCWHRNPAQRPTMSEVARRMVQLSEAFVPTLPDPRKGAGPRGALQDISAEIKKLSEYPVAGGGYCDLYMGERCGVEKVALKLVRLIGSTAQDKDAARRRFVNEARLWAELQHPRILEFYGICDYGTMSLYMVSPWLENSNVVAYLSNVNPHADRHRLLCEAAEGLVYLHSHEPPVVHGDLKAANILITDVGTAVLADFGLSKLDNELTITLLQGAGSPRWMAPELILVGDDVTGPVKTQKSDVYAYGHVMLEVLSDKKPFGDLKEDIHVIVELMHGRRSPRPAGSVADKWLDDSSWAISRQCTAVNPMDRPGMDILLPELKRAVASYHAGVV